MNPFRRIWPREIGLYLAALVLLAQVLMGIAHTAHAWAPAQPAFCAADHEHAPAKPPAQACPLCQLPSFAGPLPPSASVSAPFAWTFLVYPPPAASRVPSNVLALPPARGPPSPV